MREVADRIVLERGQRDSGELGGQTTEHRVHDAGRALGAGRAHAAHRLIDRGGRGDPLREGELVGAHPERRHHQRLELVEVAIEDVREQIVEPSAPAQGSVDELGCQRAVHAPERARAERRVQRQVRVGAHPLHAQQNAKRQQARLRRRPIAPHGVRPRRRHPAASARTGAARRTCGHDRISQVPSAGIRCTKWTGEWRTDQEGSVAGVLGPRRRAESSRCRAAAHRRAAAGAVRASRRRWRCEAAGRRRGARCPADRRRRRPARAPRGSAAARLRAA